MIKVTLHSLQETQLRREYIESDHYARAGPLRNLNMDPASKYSYKSFVLDTVPGVMEVEMLEHPDYIYGLTFRDEESLLMFALRYS